MSDFSAPAIYQLKVVLLGGSPIIWLRLLVCGDSTIVDLHYILQIAIGWSDDHLPRIFSLSLISIYTEMMSNYVT